MAFDPVSQAVESGIDGLFSLGKAAIERIWPDPVKRAEEMRKLEELHMSGDLEHLKAHVQLMVGQMEINKAEAQHKSVFVAGWRPFIGWVGGTAMAWQFVAYPILLWVWAILKAKQLVPVGMDAPPILDTGALFSVITGMLGIGAMRSWDKSKGTQTDSLGER